MDSEVIWSRRLADELWSGMVTPLTFSLLAPAMSDHLARRRLANAGLRAAAAQPVFRLVDGRVYLNATLIADAMRELPAITISEGLLDHLPECLRDSVRNGARAVLSPRIAATLLHVGWNEREWLPWRRAALFREESARIAAGFRPARSPAGLGTAELAGYLRELQERLASYLELVSWGMIYAFVFFHLTADLLERWADGTATMADLLAGAPGIQTFEIHAQLVACADAARRDPRWREVVACDEPVDVARRAAAGELGGFGARFSEMLARHGHRLLERDLSAPTWGERPEVLVETIRTLLRGPDAAAPSRRRADAEAARETALATIGTGIGGRVRRAVFVQVLSWCEEYYALRENMRYHADFFLAALRRAACESGARLAAAGALDSPEDVFYLTSEEVLAGLAGERSVGDRARARIADYSVWRERIPPDVIVGERPPTPEDRVPDRNLRGIGVSPGRCTGRVRVVRRLEDLDDIREGEVVVAASTDPSWTTLLSFASALVLEIGGRLSHGAIIARELGIPAVADVTGATFRLRTGDRITVDGSSGEVALA